MKKLLSLLVACLFLSAVPISSVTCPVAMGQDDLGQPIEMQFNIEGEEFNVDLQRANQELDPAAAAAVGVGIMVVLFIAFALSVVCIIGMWKLFEKAGKPGWAAIIPIYNMIVLLEICGRPIWWIILFFIPCVQIIPSIVICFDLAKSFGKDVLFGVGLLLVPMVFMLILGFGSAEYQGPIAAK